jgi:hypothetical protein
MLCQPNPDATYRTYFRFKSDGTPSGGSLAEYYRLQNATSTGIHSICRPFSIRETNPIRGKTVTLSFDIRFGLGFPLEKEDNGLQLDVLYRPWGGATANVNVNGDGTFISENRALTSFPPITSGPTDGVSYERQSHSFSIPSDAMQICLRIRHLPYGSGADVPSNYRFYLRYPTIHLGTEDLGYQWQPLGVENALLAPRYQWVQLRAFGIGSGQTHSQWVPFPTKFEFVPTCLRARESSTSSSSGFATASRSDISEISEYGFRISRTATANGAYFGSEYSFGALLWPFSDSIANYG